MWCRFNLAAGIAVVGVKVLINLLLHLKVCVVYMDLGGRGGREGGREGGEGRGGEGRGGGSRRKGRQREGMRGG
jgi:hypothetical protein